MVEAIPTPGLWGLVREVGGVLELPRLLLWSPWLAREPRGHGETVLVLPGFGTADGATAVLRAALRALGYDARGWGLGRNHGRVPRLLPRLVERVEASAEETGGPIALVGWSLGGYLAREVARERPDAVRLVITLGSPVVGGPKYTVTARRYTARGYDLDEIESQVEERAAMPLKVPVTAVYSKHDGVVSWQACIDRREACVEHVEVCSTHLGLGFSPDVLTIIVRRLARR